MNRRHVNVEIDAVKITLQVFDDGIGIFRKISQELGLADDRHALLELAKGKFTTSSVVMQIGRVLVRRLVCEPVDRASCPVQAAA